MSAPPPEGYGQPQYGQQFPDHQGQQQYDEQHAQSTQQQDAATHGKKKKRGYAAGAFEVGGNATVAGQVPPAAPQYGMAQPAVPQYGYQQPDAPQPPAQAYQYPDQTYPAQQQPAYGGYQAPAQGYQAPGAPLAPAAPGVAGVTQAMGGMQLGGQPQQQPVQQGQAQQPRAALNQLYPTDLLNQPFNASELDLPPPPINLPPNVSSAKPHTP